MEGYGDCRVQGENPGLNNVVPYPFDCKIDTKELAKQITGNFLGSSPVHIEISMMV